MRIGIDASRANVEHKTGTEWYSYWLIKGFSEIADIRDQYFLFTKDKLRGEYANLNSNFHSVVLAWPPKFLWTQLRLSMRLAVKPVDVLFVPAHTLPLIHGKKTILTVHDVGFERRPELYSKSAIGSDSIGKKAMSIFTKVFTRGKYGSSELDYHRWAMRHAIRNATKIIVPSQFTKNEIVSIYNIPEDNIYVIYHGVDRNMYYKINDQCVIDKELDRLKINKPYFIYVGRLEKKKNTAGLIKAFARFKKETKLPHLLILVGQPGYGFEEIRSEILKSSYASDIIMPGYLEPKSIVILLNKATAFIFPSYYEGFGLPLIEAMECGAPVIASQAASIPEIAGQAADLFNTAITSELTALMRRLATNEAHQKSLRAKGFIHSKKYDWNKCAKETLTAIKDI